MEVNEKELITRAQNGDRKAFDKLVTLYRDKMFALTYRMTGDREIALDLTQDTFFTAYKEIRKFRAESAFSSWIYRIASNKALNWIKRQKTVSFVSLGAVTDKEPSYESDNPAVESETREAMLEIINALPPKQKLVFNLRFYDELPFNEIARITGKAESTVKTNYQKALEKLKNGMRKYRQ